MKVKFTDLYHLATHVSCAHTHTRTTPRMHTPTHGQPLRSARMPAPTDGLKRSLFVLSSSPVSLRKAVECPCTCHENVHVPHETLLPDRHLHLHASQQARMTRCTHTQSDSFLLSGDITACMTQCLFMCTVIHCLLRPSIVLVIDTFAIWRDTCRKHRSKSKKTDKCPVLQTRIPVPWLTYTRHF
jgi:hypothetical protein